MQWWIELVLSTVAYWICAAVVVVILTFFLGHCAHGSDLDRSECIREARIVIWAYIAIALTAYLAIVGWWVGKRGRSSEN